MTETKKHGGVRTPGPGKSLGRPPKGSEPLSETALYLRLSQRQAEYLSLVAVVKMDTQDVVRQALNEFIDRQTGGQA